MYNYEDDLRHNRLFLPSCLILDHNWKAASFWSKIKYLILNKFNKEEAKIKMAVDYYNTEGRKYDNSYEQ